MIINIRLTENAIRYVEEVTGTDRETAEEVAQMVITLSEKSGSIEGEEKPEGEGSGSRIRRLAEDVLHFYKWMVNNPGAPIAGRASFEASLKRLEQALEEGERGSS